MAVFFSESKRLNQESKLFHGAGRQPMVWTSVLVCSALRTAEPQAAPVSALSSLAMAGAVAAAVARVTLESLLPRGRGVVTLHHLRTCALESSCPIQVLAPTLTSCLTLGKLLLFFF